MTDDPDNDPVWVAIRNPRLIPPHELTPDQDTVVVDGEAADPQAAARSMHKTFAKLIIGWRVYDCTTPVELNEHGEDITEQVLLPSDRTPENVARLPMEIINAIADEVKEASTPR